MTLEHTSETFFGRDYFGAHFARTHVVLPNSKLLVMYTSKFSSGGVGTTASVYQNCDGGHIRHRLYVDYGERVLFKAGRCTEKTVRELHAQALTQLDEILLKVAHHYRADDMAKASN